MFTEPLHSKRPSQNQWDEKAARRLKDEEERQRKKEEERLKKIEAERQRKEEAERLQKKEEERVLKQRLKEAGNVIGLDFNLLLFLKINLKFC